MKKTILTIAVIATFTAMPVTADDGRVRLVISLERGAEPVAQELDYVKWISHRSTREVIEVDAEHVDAIKASLKRRDGVRHVERTGETTSKAATEESPPRFNDPGFPEQVYWNNPENTGNMGESAIADAHQIVERVRPIRIAVVDTGFSLDGDHLFTWAGGWNFNDAGASPDIGPQFQTDGSNCTSVHGQAVASIMGDIANSGTGITGMLDGAFYGVRVQDCAGNGTFEQIADGIEWAANVDLGPDVDAIGEPVDLINLSLGGTASGSECPQFLQDAINVALGEGILLVAAAGNDGENIADDTVPASCDGVISVSAVNQSGQITSFSNTGATVDMSAMGEQVRVSTTPFQFKTNGTSYSTPIVTGIAGMLMQNVPGLLPTEMTAILRDAAAMQPIQTGEHGTSGAGLGVINAMNVLNVAVDLLAPLDDVEMRNPFTSTCEGPSIAQNFAKDLGIENVREVISHIDNPRSELVVFKTDSRFRMSESTVVASGDPSRVRVANFDSDAFYGAQFCNRTGSNSFDCESDSLIPLAAADL